MQENTGRDRRNLVVFVLDTLHFDVVQHQEPFPDIATPNLDALRREGVTFTRGFLHWEFIRGQESDNWKGGSVSRKELAHYTSKPDDQTQTAVLRQYLLNKRHFTPNELSGGMTFARAIDWLDENHDLQPFMLWIECFDPHEPWDPPRAFADRYMPDFQGREFIFPHMGSASAAEQERMKALYFGEVTYVDSWLGRLLSRLADLRLLDSTVVMFVSDHGTELLDHGRVGKSAPHLDAHNTQLNWVIRHPGGPGGREVGAFVQNQDFLPTALRLLEIPALAVDGVDAWPLVTDTTPGLTGVITGWGDFASVRSCDWNYIVNTVAPAGSERLFSLRNDPLELTDIASDHSAKVAECRYQLETFLGAPLPVRYADSGEGATAPARVYAGGQSPSRENGQAGFV